MQKISIQEYFSLLTSVKKIISESKDDLSYLNGKSFGVQKQTLTCSDQQQKWLGFADDGQKFKESKEGASSIKSSINLNRDVLCKDQPKNAAIPVYFIIFRNSKLFGQDKNEGTSVVSANGLYRSSFAEGTG
jgi:hypothetical protein